MNDDLDKILMFCEGRLKTISARQMAKYENLLWVDSVIRQHLVKSKIIPLIMKKFGFEKQFQADKYYKEAQYLFGKVTQIDKKYYLELVLSKQFAVLKAAKLENNLALQAKLLKDIQDYIIKYQDDAVEQEQQTDVYLSIDHNLLENAPSLIEAYGKIKELAEKENFSTDNLLIAKYIRKYGNSTNTIDVQ